MKLNTMITESTRNEIRSYINNTLSDEKRKNSKVLEAARYMALNEFGGLYRPMLLLATAKGYSVPIEKAMPIAVAIEYVHVASLIEDDIMDKSEFRRGKPACHTIYGKDNSHLAHMLLRENAQMNIDKRNNLTLRQRVLISNIASNTGSLMVYGQEKDTSQHELETAEKIIRMYEEKSGALIGAALESGGVIGGASKEDLISLNKMGVSIGVSYQIVDDALDEKASMDEIGKPVNQDLKKKTLLKLIGWEKVMKIRKEKDEEVDRLFNTLQGDHSLLGYGIHHLRGRHSSYLTL